MGGVGEGGSGRKGEGGEQSRRWIGRGRARYRHKDYYYKAFIPRHSSGLKTCSEALIRHSVDKHTNK